MIRLRVEPRVSRTWEAFCAETPPRSIALDGYVRGRPAFSAAGPHVNFDHHEDVDRLSTRSTCMQVHVAITLGLFDVFQVDGEPDATVFVNDPDQDTCLAVWLLRHPQAVGDAQVFDPLARLLVAEDLLDMSGGSYPLDPTLDEVRRLAWVFAPYTQAREAGGLPTMDAAGMEGIVEAVMERITAFTRGEAGTLDLDARFERIGGGRGWSLIVEHGAHARSALAAAGIHAFVSCRERSDGRWTYVIGRLSPFVPFPVPRIYGWLNEAEGLDGEATWGGSDLIGGSPRERGSALDPRAVARVIEDGLAGR